MEQGSPRAKGPQGVLCLQEGQVLFGLIKRGA